MTNPIFTSGMAAARRAMRRHQDVPPRSSLPTWKLLLGELVHLLRQLAQPRRLIPALVAATLIAVGLSPWTPGPVAAPTLRVVLASVAAALGVWAGPRLFRSDSWDSGEISGAAPVGSGGESLDSRRRRAWIIAAVVLVVAVVVAIGWALTVLVAASS